MAWFLRLLPLLKRAAVGLPASPLALEAAAVAAVAVAVAVAVVAAAAVAAAVAVAVVAAVPPLRRGRRGRL